MSKYDIVLYEMSEAGKKIRELKRGKKNDTKKIWRNRMGKR